MQSVISLIGVLCCASLAFAADAADQVPVKGLVRIASGVSGHIHPAACVTKQGTVLVIFGQSDYKDLRLARSEDGGRTWSEPVAFEPSAKLSIYPGALTTLADGRIVHVWNTWFPQADIQGGKNRHPQFSISTDDGKTWSQPHSLPKNPAEQSVSRHPFIELSPRQWVFTLMDQTVVFDPETGTTTPFGDGRKHTLTPLVRTPKGTLVTGTGLRSTDGGKSWQKVEPFPKVGADGWRYDMMVADNGWIVTAEVIGPGTGGDFWRWVVSRDDGHTWDFDAGELYNPGRPIGGRACPKTVQLDRETLGAVFYDVDAKQAGGPGVYFLRTPLANLAEKN
jgi:hypothetical protein